MASVVYWTEGLAQQMPGKEITVGQPLLAGHRRGRNSSMEEKNQKVIQKWSAIHLGPLKKIMPIEKTVSVPFNFTGHRRHA